MAEIYLKHLKDKRMYAQCYRQVRNLALQLLLLHFFAITFSDQRSMG